MSALPDDDTPTADALRMARHAVEEATRQLDELSSALEDHRSAVDHLESVLDVVLAATETAVVVVDTSRRVTAVSQGAASRLGASVESALVDVVPAPAARYVGELLDGGGPVDADLPGVGAGARVHVLATGHAVLVVPRP
jgi:hypothetical protein